jgi:hypothetical protein
MHLSLPLALALALALSVETDSGQVSLALGTASTTDLIHPGMGDQHQLVTAGT